MKKSVENESIFKPEIADGSMAGGRVGFAKGVEMTNCEPSVKFRRACAEAIRQMVIAGHDALGAIEPLVLAEIVTAGRAAGHFSEAEARHAMIVATSGGVK